MLSSVKSLGDIDQKSPVFSSEQAPSSSIHHFICTLIKEGFGPNSNIWYVPRYKFRVYLRTSQNRISVCAKMVNLPRLQSSSEKNSEGLKKEVYSAVESSSATSITWILPSFPVVFTASSNVNRQ